MNDMVSSDGIVDLATIQTYVDAGLISRQVHPVHPLFIFNYTARAQYDRHWDNVTLACRGLIVDETGNVVARPFPKFFNLEELTPDQIPAEPFDVFDKLDGSLGILYWVGDEASIATRGSFQSEQAQIATQLLRQQYGELLDKLDRSVTYLFEIIYPQNRIVVDYGQRKELVLIAMMDTSTGNDLPLVDVGFPVVKQYNGLLDLRALKAMAADNAEGFVVRFQSGFRCKVKFEDYVRLHRILTGISNVVVWEHLSTGQSFDELLERVPDEFYQWVKLVQAELISQYEAIESACRASFQSHQTRKESAMYFQTQKYPSILFKMLDDQPYDHLIWKLIRPKYAKSFSVDNE